MLITWRQRGRHDRFLELDEKKERKKKEKETKEKNDAHVFRTPDSFI